MEHVVIISIDLMLMYRESMMLARAEEWNLIYSIVSSSSIGYSALNIWIYNI